MAVQFVSVEVFTKMVREMLKEEMIREAGIDSAVSLWVSGLERFVQRLPSFKNRGEYDFSGAENKRNAEEELEKTAQQVREKLQGVPGEEFAQAVMGALQSAGLNPQGMTVAQQKTQEFARTLR